MKTPVSKRSSQEEGGAKGISRMEEEYERVAKKAKEAYERNRTTPPTPVDINLIPRRETVVAAEKDRVHIPSDPKHKRILQVFRGGPFRSSTKTVEELEHVAIRQLICPTRNEGKVLICRVLTTSLIGNGITFHVEDPEGFSLPVTIQHPTPRPSYGISATILQDLYPPGTTLAIKEPDVRFGLSGAYALRVEVPVDVVLVNGRSSTIARIKWSTGSAGPDELSWEEHKAAGNMAMGRREYMAQLIAIRHYTLALGDPEVTADPYKALLIGLNRAQAYLDIQQFGSAYRECHYARTLVEDGGKTGTPIEITQDQKKKLYWRMMKAAYGLRLCDEAQAILTSKCSGLAISELPDYVLKIVTQKTGALHGRYDWTKLWEETRLTPSPNLDVADYTGPIEVRIIPGRGRGLVLTQNVQTGQVLLASKAVITGHLSEAPNTALVGLDFGSNISTDTTQVLALDKAIHRLLDDPSFMQCLNGLHTGRRDDPASVQNEFPIAISEEQRLADILQDRLPEIDINKIAGVLDANSFGVSPLSRRASDTGMAETATMLFGLPSLANHSCLPNVMVVHWGDMIVYRALYDIPSDTELLVSYFSGEEAYIERSTLAERWGFTCSCPLCVTDRKDDYVVREMLLGQEYPKALDHPDPRVALKEMMQLEKKVASTYQKGREGMRPELRPIWRRIADFWWKIDGRHSIPAERLSLECVGTIFSTGEQRAAHGRTIERLPDNASDGKIISMLNIAHAYFRFTSNPVEGTAWARTAYWAHEMILGGGLAIFLERFQDHLPHGYPIAWET
ncbi:hypothetical protein CI109_102171 [Kwoniella shandongensis]|uniref:Uncharacterized protein n=1 Tax=Kwoniella shandongensis TaxID=1734106 RepID=A0A5M6C378_9TREE|nr:uncharacterized protein CI109_003670 [Kwoniella shandongensis]KAA5528015.1 hypothetical protein CI109_003670 [Kwoniella shandongensis]